MDDLDDISIHALREEGDDVVQVCKLGDIEFLSTPSARRATHGAAVLDIVQLDFYPRPPRGGRLILRVYGFVNLTFLSTPSARRATSPSGA